MPTRLPKPQKQKPNIWYTLGNSINKKPGRMSKSTQILPTLLQQMNDGLLIGNIEKTKNF